MFLSLPSEIRFKNYEECEAIIRADLERDPDVDYDVPVHPSLIRLLRQPLLQTCKATRSEILALFKGKHPLVVDWHYFDCTPEPLAILPTEYLRDVAAVSITIDGFFDGEDVDLIRLLSQIPKVVDITIEIHSLSIIKFMTFEAWCLTELDNADGYQEIAQEIDRLYTKSIASLQDTPVGAADDSGEGSQTTKNLTLHCNYGRFQALGGQWDIDGMPINLSGPVAAGSKIGQEYPPVVSPSSEFLNFDRWSCDRSRGPTIQPLAFEEDFLDEQHLQTMYGCELDPWDF